MTQQDFDILILDDDDDISYIVDQFVNTIAQIRKFTPKIKVIHDGLEGLQELYNSKFGLVILDINMPKVDGIEIVKSIRSNSGLNSQTSILIMSGFPSAYYDRVDEEFLQDKILFLDKPFEFTKFERFFLIALCNALKNDELDAG